MLGQGLPTPAATEARLPCSFPPLTWREGAFWKEHWAGPEWALPAPLLPSVPQEASLRFTLPGSGTEGPAKQENFILGSCG